MVTTSDICDPNFQEPIWDYDGDNGPDNWDELSRDYRKCGLGQKQSPINIDTQNVVRTKWYGPLRFEYNSFPDLILKNTGREIEITFSDDSNKLVIAKQEYELKEVHFHALSEHTVDHCHYPVEIHLVHERVRNSFTKRVVVAVFINPGKPNSFLNLITSNLLNPIEIGCERNVENTNEDSVKKLLPRSKDFYHYSGSLTTPPCTENVHWIVFKEPLEASELQISQLSSVFPFFNTRPIQLINNRLVKLIVNNKHSGDNKAMTIKTSYLHQVEAGESIIVIQAGQPIAEIRPIALPVKRPRPFGLCAGEFVVPDDFDAPLPEDILNAFEGR